MTPPLRSSLPPTTERGRLAVLLVTTLAILGWIDLLVIGKEEILRDGRVVLLRLAPADPRSLMQGDYMALRYAIADPIAAAAGAAGVDDGTVVVELDALGEARFVAIDGGGPLADRQQRLRFRRRGDVVRLASDAFFFEEGSEPLLRSARFGELRVAPDGEAVLVGLRNASGERLSASREPL